MKKKHPLSPNSSCVYITVIAVGILFISLTIHSHFKQQQEKLHTLHFIEETLTKKLNSFQEALKSITEKLKAQEPLSTLFMIDTFNKYKGHKIYLTTSASALLGSLALGEIRPDNSAIFVAGTSLLSPEWDESYLKRLFQYSESIQISEPFKINRDDQERLINLGFAFPYQNKILFINTTITPEEFFADIEKVLLATSFTAEIRDLNDQEVIQQLSSKEVKRKTTPADFAILNDIPYKIALLHKNQSPFDKSYLLIAALILVFSNLFIYRRLQKNHFFAKN